MKRFLRRIPGPLGAVLLGALTYVVTPLVALAVTIPFLIVTGFRKGAAVELIAKVFHLEGLGGLFGAMLFLAGLFWLLGAIAMAFLSWRIYRDQRLAALTLVSAFGFQIIGTMMSFVASTWNEDRDFAAQDSAFAGAQRQIETYATLGPPIVSIHARRDHWSDDHPEFGPYYESLDVAVPIVVHRPGTYHLDVHYEYMRESAYRFLGDQEVSRTLPAGPDTLQASFRPGMYRAPDYTGGLAWAKASYQLTQRQYLEMAKPSMHMSRQRLRELETFWKRIADETREEFVDSSGTFFPRPVPMKKYVPPHYRTDRDDRGRLLHPRPTRR